MPLHGETGNVLCGLEVRSEGQARLRFEITHEWYSNPSVELKRWLGSMRLCCAGLRT